MEHKAPGQVWLVLAGTMAVGKTTAGRGLAQRLGLPFVDLDAWIEDRFGPIPQLFASGEERFRQRESEALQEVLASPPGVLALGGGTFAVEANRRVLASVHARVIALVAPWPVVAARLGNGNGRPLAHEAEQRYRSRASSWIYAEHQLDASGAPAEVLAALVTRVDPPRRVPVSLGARSYEALQCTTFGPLAQELARLEPSSWRLLVDPGAAAHADPVREALRSLDRPGVELAPCGGELAKTWDQLGSVLQQVLATPLDRGGLLVSLGGGALGDLTGLAASLLLRGVRWVHLPTTLLAMVDASVGGKTAVNLMQVKNLVGAFHQPALVFAATRTLTTLPVQEWRSGLGELVKTALVGDPQLFEVLEEQAERLAAPVPEAVEAIGPLVASALQVKARLVSVDERDQGDRLALNAGHTVGHALESAVGLGRLRHGELVAVGLLRELAWAEKHGLTSEPGLPNRVARLLTRLGLSTDVPAIDRESALIGMRLDKKAMGDTLRLPVPVAVGNWRLVDLPLQRLPELLA